ncbi:GTPase-associated protein 1-related protein [Paractinoplanes globisporus]|uniref:GTPase-associated protein 1-related protein n=1 Tax=Paractinoplanes globisporus TaxID=113565 RepID=A0ABW6W771_9ACTN|nr:GTPase-associated protein 1-related protein [Actinoplanes globisporus]
MAFGQMYYTSCRKGLSGAPGFQFNAVSRGIGPDVLREAEALTSYQPPRAIAQAPSEENVRRAPVNLCYLPGPTALLANVVYVGADYSRRPGNYFAHTLVSRDPGGDLRAVLPIELWRAPFWVRDEVDGTELPELPGPLPTGALDRTAVAVFLREHQGAAHLPALLTAAEETVRTKRRKVVVAGADSDEVARWIATLSYLLPPATAARMSFATYDRDPRYSRVDVIGAIGGVDLDLGGNELTAYHLFDFTAGRVSAIDVHPLARILAELDPADAGEAWSRATEVAGGDEQSFDDWLPVVAAALMTWPRGPESARDEPAVVAAWLSEHASRLAPDWVGEVGRAVLAFLTAAPGESDLAALRDLAVAASRCPAAGLLDAVEVRSVDVLFAGLRATGEPAAGPQPRLTTDRARRHAVERISAELPNLPASATARLVAWADAAGLALDPPALERAGERIVGPAVLHNPDDELLRDVLARTPPMRAGVVRYLDAVGADELDRMVDALGTGLADLLGRELAGAGPWTRRAVVVAEVRSGVLDEVDGLAAVVSGPGPVDDRLLSMLFGDRPWTLDQARRILDLLDDRGRSATAVLRRIEDTVLADGDEKGVGAYARFCARLRPTAVYAGLGDRARARIDLLAHAASWIHRLSRQRKDYAGPIGEFRKWFAALAAADQRLVEAVLAARFDEMYPPVRARLLVGMPGLRHAYCAGLSQRLSRREGDVETALAALVTLAGVARLNPTPPVRTAAGELDGVLRRSVGRWNGRAQHRLLDMLALDHQPATVAWIAQWMEQLSPGMLGRVRGLLGRGRGAPEGARAGWWGR